MVTPKCMALRTEAEQKGRRLGCFESSVLYCFFYENCKIILVFFSNFVDVFNAIIEKRFSKKCVQIQK